MGMYTTWKLDFHVDDFYGKGKVIQILDHLINGYSSLIKESLIKGIDNKYIQGLSHGARNVTANYNYVDGDPESYIEGNHVFIYADIKNYESEYYYFWDWIQPYIVEPKGTIIGECLYEENDEPSPVIVGKQLRTGTQVVN